MSSRVVVLPNRSGRKLLGILDEPSEAAGIPVAAVLLSPGVKTRVGPHRLYRKLAPAFLSRGMPVLRGTYSHPSFLQRTVNSLLRACV